ncbi:septum formation initiator [Streptomyces sp. NPDC088725]|uniref:FtsB family cell division protein n=1 Tax=Streptomyces sp. NPDC088725 TaxID=3365873 RepID=UPI0038186D86
MSGPAKQLKGRAARLAQLMPSGPNSAARTPFVLLVVLLLGGGLITLLLLNSSLNEGSFKLSALKKQTTDLTDEQQALQRDVDDRSAPYALERRARELGMVPGGSPAFLKPDGGVQGVPEAAPTPPPGHPSVMAAAPPLTSSATPGPTAGATSGTTPGPTPVPAPGSTPGPTPGSVPGPAHSPASFTSAPAQPSGGPAPTTPGR